MAEKKKTVVKKGGRKRTIILVSIASVLGVSCIGYYILNNPLAPDMGKQSSDEIVKYLASPEFAKLSDDVKKEYYKGVSEKFEDEGKSIRREASNLPEEDRKQLRANTEKITDALFKERINKYFTLSKEERAAYLDNMIDDMEKRRAERQKARENSGQPPQQGGQQAQQGQGGQRDPGRGLERLRKRIEGTDSDTRAKQVQFFKDMRERMGQRNSGK